MLEFLAKVGKVWSSFPNEQNYTGVAVWYRFHICLKQSKVSVCCIKALLVLRKQDSYNEYQQVTVPSWSVHQHGILILCFFVLYWNVMVDYIQINSVFQMMILSENRLTGFWIFLNLSQHKVISSVASTWNRFETSPKYKVFRVHFISTFHLNTSWKMRFTYKRKLYTDFSIHVSHFITWHHLFPA